MKNLFVKLQSWYKPDICEGCPDFRRINLDYAKIAYCVRIEKDQDCIKEDGKS